jgi:putative transposase
MNSTLNLSRKLYNVMLQQRVFAYRSGKHVSYTSQQNEMPEIKKRFPEYRNIHSLAMQDVARRLEKAFDNFYRRIKDLESGKM